MTEQMRNFLKNVYRYICGKEGTAEFAIWHLRAWGLTQEQWHEIWEGEEIPEVNDKYF